MDDNEFILDDGYTPEDTPHKPYRPAAAPRPSSPLEMPRGNGYDTRPRPAQPQPRYGQPDVAVHVENVFDTAPAETPAPPAERPQTPKKTPAQKKAKPRSANAERTPLSDRIVNFFTDERTRVFLALVLLLGALFVIIAVYSHFRHGSADQSAVINLTLSEIAEGKGLVENAGGGFGAWLSYVLLCDALGLGSLVLIVYMVLMALALLDLRKCSFWGTTFRSLLVAITISTVLGLLTFNSESTVYWGGNHGHYINKFLLDHTYFLGAALVSIFLVSAVICVYLNELRAVWHKWREMAERRREQLRLERRQLVEKARQQAANDTADDYDLEEEEEEEEDARIKPIISPLTDMLHRVTDFFKGKKQSQPDVEEAPEEEIEIDRPDSGEVLLSFPESTTDTDTTPFAGAAPRPDTTPFIITPQPAETLPPKPVASDGTFNVYVNEIELPDSLPPQTPDLFGPYDHRASLSRYIFPSIDILEDRPCGPQIDMVEQQANKERIERTLLQYNIPISRIEATVGPTVTLYEIVPADGVRINQIKRLEDDIALSLSALGIRIIAPIPGKGTVGIEVPNRDPRTVSMRSVINSRKYQECKMALPMAMGATISNDIFIADLAKMPHLLVAGATGMGKSVGLNTIIASLLYKKHPTELKFVLIDPKMVEFSLYSRLERHYLAKLPGNDDAIITDMKKVIETLNSLCVEMDNRYELLRDANVRSLEEYNKKFSERKLNPEKGHTYLPYIVVVVDEFADLIMTQGKEVENPIARIAQKARAVGIHMILATQRPSTNVITGLIKANFPGRIAFRVIQMVDSRTILDCPGANQLIGRGDMLFSHNGIMERVQCAFISTEEVERLTEYIDDQMGFEHAYYLPEYVPEDVEGGVNAGASMERDALFDEAARFVVTRQMGSTSSLQRQFGIGYNRAGKLMDQMEAAGIVGPVNGSKPRAILVDISHLDAMLGQG